MGTGPLPARQLSEEDFQEEVCEAMWLAGTRVRCVGTEACVMEAFKSSTGRSATPGEVCDLGGKTVLPGFIDAHIHVGLQAEKLTRMNLTPCDNNTQVVAAVKDAVARVRSESSAAAGAHGTWVLGEGWDQERCPSRQYPQAADLDVVSPSTPVLLWRCCYHICVANTACMRALGIIGADGLPAAAWASTEAGSLDLDPLTGRPTGILREDHAERAFKGAPSTPFDERKKNTDKVLRRLASVGITSVQTNDQFEPMPVYQGIAAEAGGVLPIRVYLTPVFAEMQPLFDGGVKTGDVVVSDYLRWGRVKLFADGALGAATAALRDPYVEKSCEKCQHKGMLRISAEDLKTKCRIIHEHGWQAEIHIIGDAAAEAAITALELAGQRRHVLTHCQVLGPDLITRMSRGDMVGNIQPVFLRTDWNWAEDRLGAERIEYSYAWRTMMREGVVCSGGSDAPVEAPDPLLGIFTSVARQDEHCRPEGGWLPKQKLSLSEATRLFTHGGAHAEFAEHDKGSLEAGKLADFIVLDCDPFDEIQRKGPAALLETKIEATVVGGRVVVVNKE